MFVHQRVINPFAKLAHGMQHVNFKQIGKNAFTKERTPRIYWLLVPPIIWACGGIQSGFQQPPAAFLSPCRPKDGSMIQGLLASWHEQLLAEQTVEASNSHVFNMMSRSAKKRNNFICFKMLEELKSPDWSWFSNVFHSHRQGSSLFQTQILYHPQQSQGSYLRRLKTHGCWHLGLPFSSSSSP